MMNRRTFTACVAGLAGLPVALLGKGKKPYAVSIKDLTLAGNATKVKWPTDELIAERMRLLATPTARARAEMKRLGITAVIIPDNPTCKEDFWLL